MDDRSELALWAEGTDYTTDELLSEYRDYCTLEIESGREPVTAEDWANQFIGH